MDCIWLKVMALDKTIQPKMLTFFLFVHKALLMSTHNIYFFMEKIKVLPYTLLYIESFSHRAEIHLILQMGWP